MNHIFRVMFPQFPRNNTSAGVNFIIFAIFITRASGNELYEAILSGDEAGVIELLDRKPPLVTYDVNNYETVVTTTGNCPLLTAIRGNQEDIAVLLIKRGADVDKMCGKSTMLRKAIRAGMPAVVEQILEKGVDVGEEIAVEVRRELDCRYRKRRTRRIYETRAEIYYTTYLHEAIMLKEAAIVRLLCEKNSDLNYVNHTGCNPLQAAIQRGCGVDIVRILLRAGSDVNAPNGKGDRAIHLAIRKPDYEMDDGLDIVELILAQKNFSIEVTDYFGFTPLMTAAYFGNAKAFELLLAKGANVHTRSSSDKTILHQYPSCENEAMVTLAKFYGFDLESTERMVGNTPFLFAANGGKVDGMNVLAKHGANVNAVNDRRKSAIHFAVDSEDHSEEMLEILLFYGVDLELPAKMGKPLDFQKMAEERKGRLALTALFEVGFAFTDEQVTEYFRDYCSVLSDIAKNQTFPNFQEMFFKAAETYLNPFNVFGPELFYLVKEYENKGLYTLYKILKRFHNVKGPLSGEFESGKFDLFDAALEKITEGTYLERFPMDVPFDIVMNHNYYAWKLEKLSFNVAFACYNMNLSLDEGKKLIRLIISLNLL